MKDEEFVFRSDSRDKAITARSAKSKKTKGGRVRLPSDNLSKKELRQMSGECKSYRLNDPMTREELLSMPDDLKIVYIQAIRKKYGIPDSHLAKAMGFTQQRFAKLIKRLNIQLGKELGGRRKWDKEGFYAWWHGVDQLPTPVPEEPTEEPVIEEVPVLLHTDAEHATSFGNANDYMEDDLPVEEPDPFMGELPVALHAEIDALKLRIDELNAVNMKLVEVQKEKEAKIEWLRNECDNQRIHARILEAQMEVVRLIFGGKNNG